MSSKLPIGVATIERPLIKLFITYVFIFIISCTPVNLSKESSKNTQENTVSEKTATNIIKDEQTEKKDDKENKNDKVLHDVLLDKTIIVLFAKDDDIRTTKQFLNTFELGIYNLEVKNVNLQIESFTGTIIPWPNTIKIYKNVKQLL